MAMLAEHYDFVIGGDPDRDTVDLAVLDTTAGRLHAHLSDVADGAGSSGSSWTSRASSSRSGFM